VKNRQRVNRKTKSHLNSQVTVALIKMQQKSIRRYKSQLKDNLAVFDLYVYSLSSSNALIILAVLY
jgi:hypothetical protein